MKYILNYKGKSHKFYEMSNRKRAELIHKIMMTKGTPTDTFDIYQNDVREIYDYMDLDYSNSAEILFSNCIAIPHLNMNLMDDTLLTDMSLISPNEGDPYVLNISILVVSEYDINNTVDAQILGFMIVDSRITKNFRMMIPFGILPTSNEIVIFDNYVMTNGNNTYKSMMQINDDDAYGKFIFNKMTNDVIMKSWYMIQFMLLNPIIKTKYSHNSRARSNSNRSEPIEIAENSKPKQPRHLSPVRMNVKNIKNILNTYYNSNDDNEHRHYNRHTMCWYVRGHFRTSKNGVRTYIKPQWKGPMAQLKRVQTRENIIDVPKEQI